MPDSPFNRLHTLVRLTWPLLLIVALSVPFALTDLDVRVSELFYDAESRTWTLGNSAFVTFIYDFGPYLTWMIAWLALAVLITGLFLSQERAWRRPALFFVLAVALGPGLLVNGYSKNELDRPRPRQTVPFGGDQPFQRVGHFAPEADGASFPSGHASMGFAWIAPAYYFRARRPQWSRGFVALALVHGGVLGFARIAAGGHFLSDVLWAAGANCIVAIALSLAFGLVSAARGHYDDYARDVLGKASLPTVP